MKIYVRFIPMVLIMGIIFYLSHQPGDSIHLPSFVGFDLPAFKGIDKFYHIITYASLAGASLYSLRPFIHDSNRSAIAIAVVLFCIIYGISDEYHQSFIPGRVVSFWDVLADGFGALLMVGWWVRRNKLSAVS